MTRTTTSERYKELDNGCAIALVWREILSGIFSTLGRLARLAACVQPDTGLYQHEKLTERLKPAAANNALCLAHHLTWHDWMRGPFDAHYADLILHLKSMPHSFVETVALWKAQQPFLTFIPASALEGERSFFLNSLNTLLVLCERNERPLGGPLPERLDDPDSALLGRVLAIVREQYFDPSVSLASVSKLLHVSERRLRRALNGYTGQTFRQYLRSLRIGKAAQLLEDTGHGIKAVSAMVGYGDVSHFTQYFREVTGVTPAEFRNRKRSLSKAATAI